MITIYIFNIFFMFTLSFSNNNTNFQKIITFPFEEYSYNNENSYPTVLDFFKSQFITNIYTSLKIGTPSQTLLTFIKTEEVFLMINDDASFYNKTNYGYNPKISNSFINITALNGERFYYKYSLIYETINFYNDENCKNLTTFPKFKLNLIPLESYDNKEKPLTGQLGLLVSNLNGSDYLKTICQLKKQGYITSYKISIKYKDNHNGYIIIGEDPHIYDSNNFKENQKLTAYVKYNTLDSYLYHKIQMDKIYFYNGTEIISLLEENLDVKFYFEYGIILGPMSYYYKIKELFFDNYSKICVQNVINIEKINLTVYSCQGNNFNIKKFPTLYFFNRNMNYTFELNYNDLFYKNGDGYIFLVAFDNLTYKGWKMGKPFLKKYQLTFDFDSKTISYYDTSIKKENEESKETGTGKIILIVVIIILSGVVLLIAGYFLGKKLIEVRKKRTKRPNELDDDFDYIVQDNKNNDQLCAD